jgi:hypothetical protein
VNLQELKAKYPEITVEEIAPNPDWSEDAVGYCFVVEAIRKWEGPR